MPRNPIVPVVGIECMACYTTFKKRFDELNNMQFAALIDYGLQVADRIARPEETVCVDRMKRLVSEQFWPGRDVDITDDFPDRAERKFWCRVFFETSRAIFDRQIGLHEHSFWQTQAIHQAHATALLFQAAIRETEPQWTADTLNRCEFDRVVIGGNNDSTLRVRFRGEAAQCATGARSAVGGL